MLKICMYRGVQDRWHRKMRVILAGQVGENTDDFFKYSSRSVTRSREPFDLVLMVASVQWDKMKITSDNHSGEKLNTLCCVMDPTLDTPAKQNQAKVMLEKLFLSVDICDPTIPGQQLPCGCRLTSPSISKSVRLVWLIPGKNCMATTVPRAHHLDGVMVQRLISVAPQEVDLLVAPLWPSDVIDSEENNSIRQFITECAKVDKSQELIGPASNCTTDIESILRPTYTISTSIGIHCKKEERSPVFIGLANLGWRINQTPLRPTRLVI